jgi:phage baseplate assembly protein W
MLTPTTKRKPEIYSDFHKDMTQSPINFDLARKIDEEAVKESIKNLILTDRGERLFQPDIGSDVRRMLFENIDNSTIELIKDLVRTTIRNYEPRVNLIGVDVLTSIDSLQVDIVITFNIINRLEPVTFVVTLDRVR